MTHIIILSALLAVFFAVAIMYMVQLYVKFKHIKRYEQYNSFERILLIELSDMRNQFLFDGEIKEWTILRRFNHGFDIRTDNTGILYLTKIVSGYRRYIRLSDKQEFPLYLVYMNHDIIPLLNNSKLKIA